MKWFKSLTVRGAIISAIGVACDPNVWALLPERWARTVALVGAVCTAAGIRRAFGTEPGGVPAEPSPTSRLSAAQYAGLTDDERANVARGLSPRGLTWHEEDRMREAGKAVDWDRIGGGR